MSSSLSSSSSAAAAVASSAGAEEAAAAAGAAAAWDGWVARSKGDLGDGGDGRHEVLDQLVIGDVQDGRWEHLAIVVNLNNSQTVGERRDVQHVQQRSLGRSDLLVLGQDLNVGGNFNGTSGNLGWNTQSLEERGLTWLHTGVTSWDVNVSWSNGTGSGWSGNLVVQDDVSDRLEVGVGEDETNITSDKWHQLVKVWVLGDESSKGSSNHGVLTHKDNSVLSKGLSNLVHLLRRDVVDTNDEDRLLDKLLLELPYDDLDSALVQFKEQLKLNENTPAFLQTVFDRLVHVLDKLVIPGLENYVNETDRESLESACDIICWFYNTSYMQSRKGGPEVISTDMTLSLLSCLWTRIHNFTETEHEGLALVTSTIQVVLETLPQSSYAQILEWLQNVEPPRYSNTAMDDFFYACLRSFTARIALDELESITTKHAPSSPSQGDFLNTVLQLYDRWRPDDSTEKGEYILDRGLSIVKKSLSSEPATVVHVSAHDPETDPNCYRYYLAREQYLKNQKNPDWVQIFENDGTVEVCEIDAELGSLTTISLDEPVIQRFKEPKSKANVFRRIYRAIKPRKVEPETPVSGQLSTISTLKYRFLDWFWGFWYPVDDHEGMRSSHLSRVNSHLLFHTDSDELR
ncbi:hypothetical protein OGAPHI_003309 [Ogataea philodendri]|uniref:Uncharacterized protein n=1 Tax=Ogataea philodendri TaxID=1378263 RepID=A0A9P8T693_9ASCO|nr:uncharacterized protein OGAPHI_003309 [Ogataea philodendri]KAH3666860.1 hypothetical protein OGAPHI_003309 [Ogataea philodendri]